MTCKHPNKIWYGVEGWDCLDCPESGTLDYGKRKENKPTAEAASKDVKPNASL